MQNAFAEFDQKLKSMLEDENSSNIGVKIQLERYHRDRIGNLNSAFRKARSIDENAFDSVCEIYLKETSQPPQDYGSWGELTQFLKFLSTTAQPYLLKSCVYFEAGCLASQQIETDDFSYSDIPYLTSYLEMFSIENKCIVLSPSGYLNDKYGFTSLVQLRSVEGKIEVKRFEVNQPSFKNYKEILEKMKVHGWTTSESKYQQILDAQRMELFRGISEIELKSYYYSNASSQSWINYVSQVYPVYKPESLGLTISLHCNASCGHCYNASGTSREKSCLTWSQIEKELGQWKVLGVNEVGISGGEPFIFKSEIIEIIKGLRSMGIERIVPFSNGFWGENVDEAKNILHALKNVGFGKYPTDQIKVSYGDFHKNHIGFAAVLNIAKFHQEIIGTKLLLDIENLIDDKLINNLVSQAKEAGVAQLIEWRMRKSFSNSGRARQWYETMPLGEEKISRLRCPVNGRAAIYPDQNWVYCTGTVFPKHFLGLGKLGKDSIFFKMAKSQLSLQTVYLQFGTFGDYVNDHLPELREKVEESYPKNSTPCSYCPKIFSRKISTSKVNT